MNAMTSQEKKQRAEDMMRAMDAGNWDAIEPLLSDSFQFDLATRMPGDTHYPISREQFLVELRAELTFMFPKGFNWTYGESLCEGDFVSLQAVSSTVAANGRPYANRYHWFFRFREGRIDLLREYMDSLEAFMTCVAGEDMLAAPAP